MKKINNQRKTFFKLGAISIFLVCCSCLTTVPTTDTTPPTLEFYVDNNGGTIRNRIDIMSDTLLSIRSDANLVVWAKAIDDGGMSKVELAAVGDSKIVCINQENIASTTRFENRGNVSNSTPIGNAAVSELSAMDVVEGKYFYNCPEGSRLSQARLSYKVTATNVHGGQTQSATLTFTAPVQ